MKNLPQNAYRMKLFRKNAFFALIMSFFGKELKSFEKRKS